MTREGPAPIRESAAKSHPAASRKKAPARTARTTSARVARSALGEICPRAFALEIKECRDH